MTIDICRSIPFEGWLRFAMSGMALLQTFDMAEKEPFRTCGQKASARAWNWSASDRLGLWDYLTCRLRII